MAPTGPRDDFHNQPTQHVEPGRGEPPPHTGHAPDPGFEGTEIIDARGADPFDEEPQPTPWYRKPALLVAWLLVVLILIGLIVFGIVELLHGEDATSHTPSSTPTTTTTTSTTESTASTTTTTTTTEPSTSDTGQPSPQQPSQQPTHQSTQEPSHRHHLPPLPPVITIPQVPTVITVPPGLR